MSNVILRKKIHSLEDKMMQMPQIELVTTHYFSDGIYAREIFIPKGTMLTGMIHKEEHINIISKGEIKIITDEGPKLIRAPHTMLSTPGTKRVGLAVEDTVWTTIHANPTNETDIAKLEERLVTPRYTEKDLIEVNDLDQLKGDV